MTKTSLKDEYASRSEVEEALAKFNQGKDRNEKLFYVSYQNSITRKWMYVQYSREFFYQWENMRSAECLECCKNCSCGKTHQFFSYLICDHDEKNIISPLQIKCVRYVACCNKLKKKIIIFNCNIYKKYETRKKVKKIIYSVVFKILKCIFSSAISSIISLIIKNIFR